MDPQSTDKKTEATPPEQESKATERKLAVSEISSKATEPGSPSLTAGPGSSSKPTDPEPKLADSKISSSLMAGSGSPSADPESSSSSKPPAQEIKAVEPKWFEYILEHGKPITPGPIMYSAPRHMTVADRGNDIFRLDRKNTNKYDPVFDPFVVSFGLMGRKKPPTIDDRKNRIVFEMLKRHAKEEKSELLKELVDAVKEFVREATLSLSSPDDEHFHQIMVIDGCVLLEIFRFIKEEKPVELEGHPFFKSRWMIPTVALEIVKIENQIPYSVLEKLFEKTKQDKETTLSQLAAPLLNSLCPGLIIETIEDDKKHQHLLSIFHSMCDPGDKYRAKKDKSTAAVKVRGEVNPFNSCNSFPSVTDLCLSGIKVVKGGEKIKLLQIDYSQGKLEIPTLVIDHNTKILMRNMIAYEEGNSDVENDFTSYAAFMGKLVNTAEDVEVLHKAGVINHFMSSNEEVSVLLRSLTENIKLDMSEGYLANFSTQIYRDHLKASKRRWTRIKRHLTSREGKNYLIAYVAAGLGVVQVFLAILLYILPPAKSWLPLPWGQ